MSDPRTALHEHSRRSPRRIVLVAFDGVQSLDVTGPLEVFAKANQRRPAAPPYEVVLASPAGGEVTTGAGLRLSGLVPLEAVAADVDTVVVAGGPEAALRQVIADTDLTGWLQRRAPHVRRIAGVCTGAFVLAAAGFLEGRRATTHWSACDQLAALCPGVRLEPDAIFVSDPPIHTSAGVTAGIDLCLSFVEADCGPAAALDVARQLVLFVSRPGGQSQFSPALRVRAAATPRLQALVAELAADPVGDLRTGALADRCAMTERTFLRAFRRELGVTPAAFVEMARVDRAKALLETSAWPLDRLAENAGFGSPDALNRAFARRVGVSPGAYRQRFGARRDKGEAGPAATAPS